NWNPASFRWRIRWRFSRRASVSPNTAIRNSTRSRKKSKSSPRTGKANSSSKISKPRTINSAKTNNGSTGTKPGKRPHFLLNGTDKFSPVHKAVSLKCLAEVQTRRPDFSLIVTQTGGNKRHAASRAMLHGFGDVDESGVERQKVRRAALWRVG